MTKVCLPINSRTDPLRDVARLSREAEDSGADGVVFSETVSDPMLSLTVAAGATERADLLTNIVVAFARSPMTLAMQARAIQDYSEGRLLLGLGSQIKPHIERRFSMPWSAPAARMAEYVSAMRAIWHSWATGDKLDFRGDFYTHTLMTPMFTPKTEQPDPKVMVAAVGEKMTETVGHVADGLLLHPFTTDRYVTEVTLPVLRRGRAVAGAPETDPEIVATPFVAVGETEDELGAARTAVCRQIAFYGSTPAYWPVLELHGLGDLGRDLNTLSKSERPDKWARMGDLIDETVLGLFAVVGTPAEAATALRARWDAAGLTAAVTRTVVNSVGVPTPGLRTDLLRALREA